MGGLSLMDNHSDGLSHSMTRSSIVDRIERSLTTDDADGTDTEIHRNTRFQSSVEFLKFNNARSHLFTFIRAVRVIIGRGICTRSFSPT